MRSRAFRENNSLNSFDDTLINLQNEIYNIRDSLVNGETKIILLRTEIGKLKVRNFFQLNRPLGYIFISYIIFLRISWVIKNFLKEFILVKDQHQKPHIYI